MTRVQNGAVNGRVAGLFIAATAGAPMQSQRLVALTPGVGIVGDRYAVGRGHWSDPRWPDQELTLVMAEVADALAIAPALLRRNIVTRGIDLETLIGVSFQLGEAVLTGVRRCDPCHYVEQFTRPGLARELGQRGGLRAHIVRGGHIRLGDQFTLLSAPAAEGDSPGRDAAGALLSPRGRRAQPAGHTAGT